MTTGKIRTVTRWTCVGKIMSLFFNTLSAAAGKSLQSYFPEAHGRDHPGKHIMMSSFEKHWNKISYHGFVCEMCRTYLLAMKNSEPIKLFSASLIHFINC